MNSRFAAPSSLKAVSATHYTGIKESAYTIVRVHHDHSLVGHLMVLYRYNGETV